MIFKRFYRHAYQLYKLRELCFCGNRVRIIPKITLINPRFISIGDDCSLGPNCRIEAWDEYNGESFCPTIEIGNRVSITGACHLGAIDKLCIGEDCLLGSNVVILDHDHGTTSIQDLEIAPSLRTLYSKGPVLIGEKCWIGENAVILPGVTIGSNSVIGANAVVAKSCPPFSVIAGNPAKIIRSAV